MERSADRFIRLQALLCRQACDCRRFGVSVVPDFQRSQTEARFRFRAWVSLFYILQEGVSALIRAAKLWQKFQERSAGKGDEGESLRGEINLKEGLYRNERASD